MGHVSFIYGNIETFPLYWTMDYPNTSKLYICKTHSHVRFHEVSDFTNMSDHIVFSINVVEIAKNLSSYYETVSFTKHRTSMSYFKYPTKMCMFVFIKLMELRETIFP